MKKRPVDPTYDIHVPALLDLPPKERLMIAKCLRDSTRVPEGTHPEGWAEIQRRIAHEDAHTQTLVPAEIVYARVERKLQQMRKKRAAQRA